ncbi:hypothetical protein [Melittangium boletus]|uniref:Uncharacterized protein n=1 Tax=Melittangium boletus DSM 14713 TaxID=1294270 RepID=A0A250IRP6_9BACT|nr:hypothetical protein [Melittangium boletus]ATB33857.1 hypothetical protein MEBOL_007358 [Melittangium boletus DSM 14713]
MLVGLLTAALLAAPLACRKPAKPSEAYYEAQTRFGKLFAAKGDEAFVDPELASIETLLTQVPEDSLDAASARELRTRIEEGKQRARSQQRAREDALASARKSGQMPLGFTEPSGGPSRPAPPPAQEADAGTDAGTGGGTPGIGTSVAELSSGFSGCFKQGESLQVQGRGIRESWELADRAACRQQYASLQDQLMIVENGKVLGLAPRSALQAVSADGGTRPAGDAGR